MAQERASENPFALAADERLVEVGWAYGLAGDDPPDDSGSGAWYFAAKKRVQDVEGALRAAIRDYLAKPGSNPNRVAFNWGDALNELDAEDWAKHGLRPLALPRPEVHVHVDHDEVFWDPDDDHASDEDD